MESFAESWSETKILAETISDRIASVDREWTKKVKIQAEVYLRKLSNRELLFRALPIWSFVEEHAFDGEDRRCKIQAMKENSALGDFSHLCSMVDLNDFFIAMYVDNGRIKVGI